MTKTVLTKEALLSKRDDLKKEEVEIDRGIVYVREMTARERNVWEQSVLKKDPTANKAKGEAGYEASLDDFYGKLAVSTICNEDGELLFTIRDARALSEKLSATSMEKIVKVAQELNAISKEDREEILKNSEAEEETSSDSNSAETLA